MRFRFLQNSNWRTLTLELFIVFIGLLAALQVDEWREQREYREAETRYLVRLKSDLDATIENLQILLEFIQGHYDGVAHVHASLAAGEILNDDVELFEYGLIFVGHLPALPVHRSAYDEMVASGMFARLRSEQLKSIVSDLYATEIQVNRNFSWWRVHVMELVRWIYPHVEYYSKGEGRWLNPQVKNEPVRRARFDFEALRSDSSIRNGFYWAVDTQSDWREWTRTILELAEQASAVVAGEIATRQE